MTKEAKRHEPRDFYCKTLTANWWTSTQESQDCGVDFET
jgi:hypothetical protein